MRESDFEAAWLTVRLGAIAENYKSFRRLAGSTAVAGVVKADGYGLGAEFIGPALTAVGCDTFFVARLEEGIALRRALPDIRIFVLDGAPRDAVPALIAHRLTPVLNSLPQIADFAAGASGPRDAAIHIDTGMNRLGLTPDELSVLTAQWRTRLKNIHPVLLMSHLACGDEAKSKMNETQLTRFRAALAMLPPAPASLAASGGAYLGSAYHFDLIRPGIGLYGGAPQEGGPALRTAALISARVLQLRRIDRGESVGYAATFHAKRPTMLATVALGYASGIPRSLSNKGIAHAAGARAPYVGRVSMDMTVLDVTELPNVKTGDVVELLGDHVLLENMASLAGTNAYEILTGLKLPRHYVDAV
ncbi:MAG TPA: alanine racemase [Rhizomicrobium sp.]|jgi:alanine racemase|nr:alanine racemase [Rhizomicrobium sp.]